jgi:pimeloyl-ACP methyl ester carboxylesterase
MSKPKIHFSHANSYPAGTYRRYFELLGEDFEIQSLDMHAHNPAFPVDDGWRGLVDELISELERRYSEPVILVGHSLGGMLSLLAAARRPDLARCVVMLDSPVVSGWRAFLWRIIKWIGREDSFSPSRSSVRRRYQWPDERAAYEHFAGKDIFAAWAPGVLQDYMQHGLVPHPDGVQLRFGREVETQVYRTLPHHVGGVLTRGLKVPVAYIAGEDSEENRLAGLGPTRALVGEHFRIVPGGHLFPMEDPALAAQVTRELICALIGDSLDLCQSEEALRRA